MGSSVISQNTNFHSPVYSFNKNLFHTYPGTWALYLLKPHPYRCSKNVGRVGVVLAVTLWLWPWEFSLYLLGGGCVGVIDSALPVIQVDGSGARTSFEAEPSSTLELYYFHRARMCCARPKY